MKNIRKIIGILALVLWTSLSFAQAPSEPGGGAGGGGEIVGGSAPIGGGLYLLLIAGFAYGFTKIKILKEEDLNKVG